MATETKPGEHWVNQKWRPMMGWVYMVTCTFDFILAPILWSILQASYEGTVTNQWDPITLRGAGLYHVAMGAVLGLTAFGRTQEKLSGASGGSTPPPKTDAAPPLQPEPAAEPVSRRERRPSKIPD